MQTSVHSGLVLIPICNFWIHISDSQYPKIKLRKFEVGQVRSSESMQNNKHRLLVYFLKKRKRCSTQQNNSSGKHEKKKSTQQTKGTGQETKVVKNNYPTNKRNRTRNKG